MKSIVPESFFRQADVVSVAKQLIGKVLVSNFSNEYTAGIITETEAYAGETDRASHAFGGRRTPRTEAMYMTGGTAYVYLCYGLHRLFNVVTGEVGVPHAVLIRSIEAISGHDTIYKRLARRNMQPGITGPAKVSVALGIELIHNKTSLIHGPVSVVDQGIIIHEKEIIASPRIGVDYAGKDAYLPYRFHIKKLNP